VLAGVEHDFMARRFALVVDERCHLVAGQVKTLSETVCATGNENESSYSD
jgi:hypothetical protein